MVSTSWTGPALNVAPPVIEGGTYQKNAAVTVENVTALRLVAYSTKNSTATLIHPGAGEGRQYVWDPTSEAADDGVNVVKATNSSAAGRWIKTLDQ